MQKSHPATNILAKWVADPAHSELAFTVKHLMISRVRGSFRNFSAEIDGEDFSTSSVHVRVDASSIFTNDEKRDAHLRGPEFFDAENHPKITFDSSVFRQKSDHLYELKGMLNMKGLMKEIVVEVEYLGTNKDPWGSEKAGFRVTGKINRKDWNLNWNAALENGGVMVGDDVKIEAELQFVHQK